MPIFIENLTFVITVNEMFTYRDWIVITNLNFGKNCYLVESKYITFIKSFIGKLIYCEIEQIIGDNSFFIITCASAIL